MKFIKGMNFGSEFGAALFICIIFVMPVAAQSSDELFAQAENALSSNNSAKASELYGKAIRSGRLDKPKLSQAFLQRGRSYKDSGSHARAVADFTNALWLDSLSIEDQARAYSWRAASRGALGQGSLSLDDFAKAKSLDPLMTATSSGIRSGQSASASAPQISSGQSQDLFDRLLSASSTRKKPERTAGQAVFNTRKLSRRQEATVESQPQTSSPTVIDIIEGYSSDVMIDWFGDGESAGQQAVTVNSEQTNNKTIHQSNMVSDKPVKKPGRVPAMRSEEPGLIQVPGLNAKFSREDSNQKSEYQAGVVESPFGSSARGEVKSAPSVTPETISYSESRVASAPPWTLGADNLSSSEERKVMPPIPRVPERNGMTNRDRLSSSQPEQKSQSGSVNWAAVEGLWESVSDGLTPTAASGQIPTDDSIDSVTRPIRNVPMLKDAAAIRTRARTIPAPKRTVQVAPQAPSLPQVGSVAELPLGDVASLDWEDATSVQVVLPSAPVAQPVAQVSALAVKPVARSNWVSPSKSARLDIPAPRRQTLVPAPVRTIQPTVAKPSQDSETIASRVYKAASRVFPDKVEKKSKLVPSRSATNVRKVGSSSSTLASTVNYSANGRYAVQIVSQRTRKEAEASAAMLSKRHQDLLGNIDPFIVRADIPGKGTYYRVRIGPYAENQSASTMCQKLKGRGTDCFAVKL